MRRLRLLLLAVLLAASCAGPAPSAPTDVRSGFSRAEKSREPVPASQSPLSPVDAEETSTLPL